jgi:endonuclease YncB( thermonuclease family)
MSGPFQASAAEPIVGQATVIDGDTIMIRSQRIRLAGMDAFEARQTCQDAAGKDYPCGRDAAFALDDFIGRRNVNCEPKDRSWGRIVAICSVDDEDLGAWMVQQGHAVDDDRYRPSYWWAEALAWWQARGAWSGSFERP